MTSLSSVPPSHLAAAKQAVGGAALTPVAQGGVNAIYSITGTNNVLRIQLKPDDSKAVANKTARGERSLSDRAQEYAFRISKSGVASVDGDHYPYIIMPKAKGDLHSLIYDSKVDDKVRYSALKQAVDSLHGMVHKYGFVYTDTKPANFLYDMKGGAPDVRIADFDPNYSVLFDKVPEKRRKRARTSVKAKKKKTRATRGKAKQSRYSTQLVVPRVRKMKNQGMWKTATDADKEVFYISQGIQLLGRVLVQGQASEDARLVAMTRELAREICSSPGLPRFYQILKDYVDRGRALDVPSDMLSKHMMEDVLWIFKYYFEDSQKIASGAGKKPFMTFMDEVVRALCSLSKPTLWSSLGIHVESKEALIEALRLSTIPEERSASQKGLE